jgi:RNA polymerase sigma-70 factor (ECF subfamily)
MEPAIVNTNPPIEPRVEGAWRADRSYLVAIATQMLGDRVEAEDVVQEAFARLHRVEDGDIDDVRAWMTVVVRRLCIDRIRSARKRRELPVDANDEGALAPAERAPLFRDAESDDPADRVTLDDEVQLALAVVLDRLTPAERTSYVLHEVFGYPFDAVAEIVGRTPSACRQLASRARRAIRSGDDTPMTVRSVAPEQDAVVERFIAACRGGDLAALMEVLDPGVVGDAVLVGVGPFAHAEGRDEVAVRLARLFGPPIAIRLVPWRVEGQPAMFGYARSGVRAVVRLWVTNGRVDKIKAYVLRPD